MFEGASRTDCLSFCLWLTSYSEAPLPLLIGGNWHTAPEHHYVTTERVAGTA